MKITEVIKAEGLRLGDDIVTSTDRKSGKPHTTRVEVIEHHPRGCRGHVHVNRQDCYDHCGEIRVTRTVDPFALIAGIKLTEEAPEFFTGYQRFLLEKYAQKSAE